MIFQAFRDYCKAFDCRPEKAIDDFIAVLSITRAKGIRLPIEWQGGNAEENQRGDIVITCAVCADTQWWIDTYGSLWEAAHWWWCGILGLNCPA